MIYWSMFRYDPGTRLASSLKYDWKSRYCNIWESDRYKFLNNNLDEHKLILISLE